MFYDRLTDVCNDILQQNTKIKSYLAKRNISEGTINRYKIGAFPSDLRYLFDRISAQELREHGIVYQADKSPFLNYPLVIPIQDAYGRSIAIGCRTLLSEEKREKLGLPKYRNSIYSKSQHLFGLAQAKTFIRKTNKAYVVEGYFDAISAYQSGMQNVVATCGTLFSNRQLLILSRYTNNVCILFDNDEAGKTNAQLIKEKHSDNPYVSVSCVFVPKQFKDLDEYFSSGGSVEYFDLEY